jgi:hypothetical protein
MKKILFLFLFLPFLGIAQSIECADCLKIAASCETCNGTTDSELFYGVVLKNKAGTITDKIRKPFKSVIQKGSRVTVKGFDDRVTEFQLPCYGYNSTASLVTKLCECQSPPSSGGGGTFTALSGDVTSTSTGGTTTINNGVITNAKLATDAVTSAKILDGTITRSDISPAFDALLTGYTTSLTNTYSLFGTAYDATNLGTFTGNLISDNVTVKQALQQVETAQEATAVTVGTKQDKVQYKQSGTNVSTSGTITKVNVIGGTAVVNGSDATQLDITIPSSAIMQYSAGNNVNVTADGIGVTATKSSGVWVVTVPVGVKLINASVNILTTDIQTSADGSGATNWVTVQFSGVQSSATFGGYRLPTIETQVIPLGTVSVTNTVPINTTGQSFIALSAGSLTARKINMANSNDHVLSFSNF